MPKISEFYGVSIYLYFREHPPPHFHARYGGEEATVSLDGLTVLEGALSPRALGLVIEWATQHREELRAAWHRARLHEPPGWIEPLR